MADNNYIKIDGTMARIPQANKYTGLVDYIIQEEGFLSKPTDIGDGKITLGSGLTDPKWHQLYKKRGNKWSAEDNRRAVEEEVRKREKWLSDSFPNWDMLPKESQEALIAYKYNYDFTPTNSPEMYKAAKNKNFKALGYQINATSKDSKFQKGLEERRLRDQNLYFSGFNNVPSVHKVPYENRVYKAMQDKVNYHNFMNSISIQNNPQPTYNPPIKFDDGGELYYPKQWNDLTMAEKAEMMKVAVQNGITTLPEIRERYNEFAMGGYVPSNRIKDRITHYEGKAMTGAIDPLSGKYSNNNSFESEAKGFYNALPEDIRDQVLSNPELADSLYSYSYNVGAGNFKKRVVPTLRRYYQGNATVSDIERSMWASGDSKLRGLQRRRAEERAGVRSALTGSNSFYPTRFSDSEDLPFTPFYNEAFNTPLFSYDVPTVTLPIEEPLVQAAEDYAYSKEALDRQERQDRLNAFNMLLSMSSPNSTGNSLMDTIGMLTGRNFAQGGRMYDGLTQNSQQMSNPLKPNIFRRPDGSYFYQEKPSSQEINVTPMNTVFDDPSQWTYVDDEGRQYTPHQSSVNNTGTITQGEDNNPLVKAANNYFRELAYRSTYDPSSLALQGKYTMPAIAASTLLPVAGEAAYPILTNPYVDAGITSAFGAHGLNKLFRGEINGPLDGAMTALEVAPLGRLAKPMWNTGKKAVAEIQNLYNNYPIRNYNINAILKSDFYNEISKQYGKEFADDLAQRLTSKEFRDYLFGSNPRKAFKAADKHLEQMQFIKDIENAGGLLGGSGELARMGTVNREGLMHDLDFFIPGSMENKTSSVVDALGLNKHNEPLLTVFAPTGVKPKVFNNTMGSVEKGYINLPQERGNVEADMFIRDHMPTKDEAVNIILDAKKQFGRPKDIADIEAFKPYSADNPIIDTNTGRGQWNPTLFDKGLFTGERYPFVQSVETYPGSGVKVPAVMNYKGEIRSLVSRPQTVNTTPQITAENASDVTPEQLDAAYKIAVESGNRPEALRLLEQAYLRSGIPQTDITMTPEGHAAGWYHGSEWGNHTIFDSSAMNATIGGTSAHGKVKGNFLTTDVPSAMRYAGSSRYSSANVPEYTSPQTFSEKIKNLFGVYKPRRLYPAERVEDYAPKPERLFDTKGKPALDHIDKVDNVVYPLYVNPGENIMRLDFQGKPWSQSPVEFPNNFYLKRHIRDDVAKTYRDEIVPYKDYETAYKAWIEDPINIRHGSTSLDGMYFDDGIRSIEGFNSAPRYETVRLMEERVPNTTNGAVQTAAKEGNTSVLMRNVIDSNGGPEGVHYAIDDFVTLKPNQQKLADITYDDNGNLIPLSQRFNWYNSDIRYGLLPFGIGLTGYGLWNNKKRD